MKELAKEIIEKAKNGETMIQFGRDIGGDDVEELMEILNKEEFLFIFIPSDDGDGFSGIVVFGGV